MSGEPSNEPRSANSCAQDRDARLRAEEAEPATKPTTKINRRVLVVIAILSLSRWTDLPAAPASPNYLTTGERRVECEPQASAILWVSLVVHGFHKIRVTTTSTFIWFLLSGT